MYNSDTRTITIRTVPSDVVAFRITDRDGNPVYGANVTLCTKGVVPTSFVKVTDLAGIAMFTAYELIYQLPPETIKEIPWLFMANIPNSEYAYWKDNVKFDTGVLHIIKLKKYTKVPIFFIKIEIRDIIGAELFSNFIAEIESSALEWAGMEVIEVKGKGTRVVTVSFKPPFHESPAVVIWAAVWFILKVLAVAGAIIAILLIISWKFGEVVEKAAEYLPWILVLIGLSIAAKPAVEYVRERRRERG